MSEDLKNIKEFKVWFINFLKSLFGQKTAKIPTPSSSQTPAPVAPSPSTSTPPVVTAPIPGQTKRIPTREEMKSVLIDMIEGKIKTRLGAWKNIRETQGANRSPEIDKLIKAQGGAMGESYCQYGQQEVLDELCSFYNVNRRKVRIPEGGSTQSVWEAVPKEFKRQTPEAMCWVTWRHGDSWKGHVGICLTDLENAKFSTFEFNTSVKADGSVERNGQGAAYCTRTLAQTGDMKIRGFADIYLAITDAMAEKSNQDAVQVIRA